MKKLLFLTIVFGVLGILNSCASNKNLYSKEKVDLKVAVIDENNEPVSDYQLWFSGKKDGSKSEVKYSNSDGFCFFDEAGKGKVFLSGYKPDYSVLDNYEINLEKNTNIYFCRVLKKESILNEVESLYKKNRFEEGLNHLEKLYTEKNSSSYSCSLVYKIYGLWKSGNYKSAQNCMKDLKKQKQLEFIELAEEFFKGVENEKIE